MLTEDMELRPLLDIRVGAVTWGGGLRRVWRVRLGDGREGRSRRTTAVCVVLVGILSYHRTERLDILVF